MEIIQQVRELSGAKSLLALKCFHLGCVWLMRQYMDGTTSSSLYEARLGFEKFGKETHAYCVGYSPSDINAIPTMPTKLSLIQRPSWMPIMIKPKLPLWD